MKIFLHIQITDSGILYAQIDEQEAVEESIWAQINSKADGNNDYVKFHFAKKDGSYHPVLDHGRIVKSRYYGNVFYVLIMDCTLVESYYSEE